MQAIKKLDDYLTGQYPFNPEEIEAAKKAFAAFVEDWLSQKRGGFQWKGTTRYRVKTDLIRDLSGSVFLNKYKTMLGLLIWAGGSLGILYLVSQFTHILEPFRGVI